MNSSVRYNEENLEICRHELCLSALQSCQWLVLARAKKYASDGQIVVPEEQSLLHYITVSGYIYLILIEGYLVCRPQNDFYSTTFVRRGFGITTISFLKSGEPGEEALVTGRALGNGHARLLTVTDPIFPSPRTLPRRF